MSFAKNGPLMCNVTTRLAHPRPEQSSIGFVTRGWSLSALPLSTSTPSRGTALKKLFRNLFIIWKFRCETVTRTELGENCRTELEEKCSTEFDYICQDPGPETQPEVPSQDYGVPEEPVVAPAVDYGVPEEPVVVPDISYGVPSADPIITTKSLPQPPPTDYGVPVSDVVTPGPDTVSSPDSFSVPVSFSTVTSRTPTTTKAPGSRIRGTPIRRQRIRYGSRVKRDIEAWPAHPGLDEPFSEVHLTSHSPFSTEFSFEDKEPSIADTYFPPQASIGLLNVFT